MRHPVAHYLSEHFPELEHPAYQTALEKVLFLAITSILVGLLTASVALLLFEL